MVRTHRSIVRRALEALFCVCLLVGSRPLLAQQIISTVAGGGPNSLAATSANVGGPFQSQTAVNQGILPSGPFGLARDAANNIYFAVPQANRVYKLSNTGQITVLAGAGVYTTAPNVFGDGGPAGAAVLCAPEGVAVDASGDVFIADSCNNVIREVVAASGKIQTVAGNPIATALGDGGPATVASLSNPVGVAVDAAGDLFIADNLHARIREVSASTGLITTVAGGGASTADGVPATQASMAPVAVTLDGIGDIFIADYSSTRVRKVSASAGTIATVLGGGNGSLVNGAAATAVSYSAAGIYVDTAGNLFAAGELVVEVPASSGKIVELVGGAGIFTEVNGAGQMANSVAPQTPVGVVTDTSGNVFFADSATKYIGEVVVATGTFEIAAGNGTPAFSGDGAASASAALNLVANFSGVATDSVGDVFFSDLYNQRVREVVAASGKIETVAGTGLETYSGDGGAATSENLTYPSGIFVDGSGDVFIADEGSQRVREVTAATGKIATIAGGGTNTGNDVPATQAQLANPAGVILDGSGNVFISTGTQVLEVVAATGNLVAVAGVLAPNMPLGDGGAALAAGLQLAAGMAFDKSGNLYIADSGHNRIREVIASNGSIQTVAGGGSPSAGNGDDGPATSASLALPVDVKIDGSGNLLIAEMNGRIRRVNVGNGYIETLAGTTAGFSGDGGPAEEAQLNRPAGLALDASGNLYVVDSNNERIRKITNATGFATASLSSGSVAFGNQNVGVSSSTSSVTVTNNGTANLNLLTLAFSGTNPLDFALTGSTCAAGGLVLAGSNCTLLLVFRPSTAFAEAATLTLTDDASPATQIITLTGTGIAPGVLLSPVTASFGNQTVGTSSSPLAITVSNTGTAPLNLTSLALSGANAADFALAAGESCAVGTPVAVSGNCSVNVVFTPSQNASETAMLTLTDNASPTTQGLNLTGAGIVPVISYTPVAFSFGSQGQGAVSSPLNSTVVNSGPGSLSISNLAFSGAFAADFALAASNTCAKGATVAAAANCTLAVTFTPSVLGAETATLTVTDNAATKSQTLALTGTGVTPQPGIGLAPATLTFAAQNVGTTSAAQTVALSNPGQAPLTLTSIAASGDFAQTNSCSASLAAGANCTLAVTFKPTAVGSRGGAITLTDNAAGSPQTVSLNGTGTGVPVVGLTPASLTFASQGIGTASVPQAVTLTNSGSAALTVTSIAASGDFAQTNTCAASISAAGTCTIAVTFTPTASGSRAGSVTLTDNAAGSPQMVALSGTGALSAATAVLAPTTLTFAAQFVDSSSTAQVVMLTNSGNAALSIASIAASGDFTQTNACGNSLAAGANCSIAVLFSPTATGARTGAITLTDGVAGSPQTAALSGTGADLTIAPPSGSSNSASVTAGSAAAFALAFTPVNGATGTFNLTCTGAPTGATCTPNPATVALSGSSAVNVALTVTTTARTALLAPQAPGSALPWLWMAVVLSALILLAARRRRWLPIVALAGLTFCAGCGGAATVNTPSVNASGTPAGTYPLTLTATSGSVSRSIALSLTVN